MFGISPEHSMVSLRNRYNEKIKLNRMPNKFRSSVPSFRQMRRKKYFMPSAKKAVISKENPSTFRKRKIKM